ncbi:MAG: OmpA family protein [Eudoraea sp.]|nr:OmpA family protein [Eudoraea sp.]
MLCLWAVTSSAQSGCEDCLTPKDSTVTSSWVLGVGVNIVDDSATPFGSNFLRIEETWNMVPYPSRLSLGKFFSNGIGIEAIGTYNRYKVGKVVDGQINDDLREYFAFDGKVSYDLNKLVGETAWFDPYIHAGGGYSSIGGLGRTTFNTGFGFNTWFSDKWGLNLNTMGKWGIEEGATKQLQHSAAVVYRFGVEKALTKKGEAKLALIEEMEKGLQRVADSIQLQKERELEKLALEEALKKKEADRLAAEENARLEAEKNRLRALEEALKDIGKVYFALNSSYLNTESKAVLDNLIVFLNDNPSVHIGIGSHTDSRGTAAYNQWLSGRRATRTMDYLVANGIASDRLSASGEGEQHLSNHCSDGVSCSEKEHRANRRSEFSLAKY